MKNKVISAVVTAVALGMSPAAFAGEGGIAGSAAFSLFPDGSVAEVAVASAIGKTTAYAGAVANKEAGIYEAFALGTGGGLTVGGTGIANIIVAEEGETGLAIAQENELSAIAIGPVQIVPGPLDFGLLDPGLLDPGLL